MLIKQRIDKNYFVELLDKTNNNNIEKVIYYIKKSGGINSEHSKLLFTRYYNKKMSGIEPDQIIERTLLILLNDGLIYFILKKHFGYDQDLYSIGKIGLVKAIDTYTLGKTSFATYGSKVIMNEILMHKRTSDNKIETKYKIASLDEPIDIYGENADKECNLYGIIPDDDDFVEDVAEKDLCKYVLKLLKYLTPTEQEILIYSYGLFDAPVLTQVQISQKLNIGQSYISKLLSKIPNKLIILLNGEDGDCEQYDKIMKSYYKTIEKCDEDKSGFGL